MEGISKKLLIGSAIILAFFALSFVSKTDNPQTSFSTNNIQVIDGDTIDVENGGFSTRVRLLGVDTPEVTSENNPSEFEGIEDSEASSECLRKYGEKAKKFMTNMTLGKEVNITTDPISDRRGDYGRLLAYISIQNSSTTLNYYLVRRGLARVYDSRFSKLDRFQSAEEEAMEEKRGLWSC